MDPQYFTTGQFAEKAAVTVRTLRYYDKVGLLKPTHKTEAGYRLYSSRDLVRLQQILALKFLGFSLDEIKRFLEKGLLSFSESLRVQKAILNEKKKQIEQVIETIEEVERLPGTAKNDWDSIIKVIRVIQMKKSNDWWEPYYKEASEVAKSEKGQEWQKKYYTEDQLGKLKEMHPGYTEEQARADALKWKEVFEEVKRLTREGKQPESPEAQEVARRWWDLVQAFTQGDAGILQSLNRGLKAEDNPFPTPLTDEEQAFINQALTIYRGSCS